VYLCGRAEVARDFDAGLEVGKVVEVHDHIVAGADPLLAQHRPDLVQQSDDGGAEVRADCCATGDCQRPRHDLFQPDFEVRHFAEG